MPRAGRKRPVTKTFGSDLDEGERKEDAKLSRNLEKVVQISQNLKKCALACPGANSGGRR